VFAQETKLLAPFMSQGGVDDLTKKTEAQSGIWLKCQRCGHEWLYKGKQIYYACCPTCLSKVRIRRDVASAKQP
jgi:acetyl-CoA carboxylase beta subunit